MLLLFKFIDVARPIDDTDIKYFKIFSLYCMEYDPSTNFFLKPNPKMCEFGDTAVIIADYNEFIERFGKALFKKYDSVVSMMDRVKFYNFRETRETNKKVKEAILYVRTINKSENDSSSKVSALIKNAKKLSSELSDVWQGFRGINAALSINLYDFFDIKSELLIIIKDYILLIA